MKRINGNLYPAGGYIFRCPDGTLLRAVSWRALFKRVEEYRKVNGIAIGNVEAEVMEQACSRSPSICYEDGPATRPPPKNTTPAESLKAAGLRWLSAVRARIETGDVPLVNEGLAAARADVCSRCPFSTVVGGGCSSCKSAVKGLAKDIRKGRPELPGAFCSLLTQHNPSAAILDDPATRDARLPAHCWRKAQ